MVLTFPFNYAKATEVVCWLTSEQPGIDLYALVKAIYFADKGHLQAYGRPVIGDRYSAMEHGMVPSLTYRALRGERKYGDERDELVDLIAEVVERREEDFPRFYPKRGPNMRLLSGSDVRCLHSALDKCRGLSFDQLRDLAHQERAYSEVWNARPPGRESVGMEYESIIDEDLPEREKLLRELRESAGTMVL